jgi:hypothetical protein
MVKKVIIIKNCNDVICFLYLLTLDLENFLIEKNIGVLKKT